MMSASDFLELYDTGHRFSEKEMDYIVNMELEEGDEDCVCLIEENYGEPRRWTRTHTRYIFINGRYFVVVADEALTELQDTSYWGEPQEMSIDTITETVVVTRNIWTPIPRKERKE